MTDHVLECAWLCPGCGHRIEAGETVREHGEAWRCAACLPAPKATLGRARTLPPNPPYMPNIANREKPHVRYATGATLEELLRE